MCSNRNVSLRLHKRNRFAPQEQMHSSVPTESRSVTSISRYEL